MEYVQKAASAPLLWAYAENCESDYRCGSCLHFKRLQQFHSAFDSDSNYLNEAQNCVIKYLHTHSLRRGFGAKRHLRSFSASLLDGTRGENKINGFNFILANQIPIKLREKSKFGQFER